MNPVDVWRAVSSGVPAAEKPHACPQHHVRQRLWRGKNLKMRYATSAMAVTMDPLVPAEERAVSDMVGRRIRYPGGCG